MKPPEETQALSKIAYNRLRHDIVSGALTADLPLRLEFLRERYGLSFSPLREALNQLQVERLVTSTSNRGFRVAALSISEMWDAIDARILIEGEALRQSLRDGDDHWEGQILSSFHALDKSRRRLKEGSLPAEDMDEVEIRHKAFHATLLAGCRSLLLLQMADTLYTQTERYRLPLLSMKEPETPASRDPDDEHRGMMTAALARDASRAVELLTQHLRSTGKFIEEAHRLRDSEAAA